MAFFSFLLKRKFYLHLLYAIVLMIILIILVVQLLKIFTHHNEAYIVPDFSGYTQQDIEDQNFEDVFDFILTDSVYNNNITPGSIVMQNPAPGSKVKKGRNIYITVVALKPEMTVMPDLKDLTLRQAIAMLKLNGLKVNSLRYKPHMAENAVISQYMNSDTIAADSAIVKGSRIDLVLGLGRNRQVPVPLLIGQNVPQTREMINLASFNIGREYFPDNTDPEHLRVYRQAPQWGKGNDLYRGDYINVWYRSDDFYNFDSLVDTYKIEKLLVDSTKNIKIKNIDLE